MASGRTLSRHAGGGSRLLRPCLALAGLFLLVAFVGSTQLFATVNPGEIVPGSVTATVGTTFDPVNGVSVTFRWRTVHNGNSVVVIENTTDYQGGNNSPSRQVIQNDNTTTHVVVVDHFPAYSPYATWGYYVASHQSGSCSAGQIKCVTWATYPGPASSSCGSPPAPGCGGSYLTFTMPTTPTNPNGPLVFSMWPVGGQNIYQGDATQSPACTPTAKNSRECNDLYVVLQSNLLSGPANRQVQMQNAVITNLDTGQQVVDNSITPQYLCDLSAPSNPPPSNWDGNYTASNICYNGTIYSINTTLRLRANSSAVPGHYQFTANFQGQYGGVNYGNPVPVTYNFTVLPTASFTPTPPSSYPAITNLAAWQSNMVNPTPYTLQGMPYRSAEWWCTNNTDTNPWWSLDNGNFTGYFDLPASIYFEAWNYDGGRVYQQIADYDYYVTGMPGYQDQAQREHWKRCAELAMEPYKDTTIASKAGFVREPNQFAYGLEMNYLRTGDPTDLTAVNLLTHNPSWNLYYAGTVYEISSRVSAYMLDNRLAAEIAGVPRNTAFVPRTVDVMLGYLDQAYNFNINSPTAQFDIHPFQIGLVMEALINYYELDQAEGNTPDARIPLEIKKALDWYSSTQYIPSTHTLAYQIYDLPVDPTLVAGCYFDCTELNDLISPAYAWYWSKTGNSTYLNEGDDLFNHVFDTAGGAGHGIGNGWTWSVKEFNQVYKWSFDYVRWRSGKNPDGSSPAIGAVQAASNPCDNNTSPCNAPWTDYTTPIQYEWWPGFGNSPPQVFTNIVQGPSFKNGNATFWFNTFKPNTTLTVYYGTSAPGTCNLNNPQPPNCMQPFPNFGFQQMLSANYANHSAPSMGMQDQTAMSQGINNVYDATVIVTGLTPGATYHWRPLTTDANGNMAAFPDQTFTVPSH